jgi:hypothetical protein
VSETLLHGGMDSSRQVTSIRVICVKEGGRANRAHLIAVEAGVVEEDPGSVVQNENPTASRISALWRVNSVLLEWRPNPQPITEHFLKFLPIRVDDMYSSSFNRYLFKIVKKLPGTCFLIRKIPSVINN